MVALKILGIWQHDNKPKTTIPITQFNAWVIKFIQTRVKSNLVP